MKKVLVYLNSHNALFVKAAKKVHIHYKKKLKKVYSHYPCEKPLMKRVLKRAEDLFK